MVVVRVFICVSMVIVTSSVPIAEDGEPESGLTDVDSNLIDYLRGKRLNDNLYAISPCAAAAAAAAASSLPIAVAPETAYPNNFMPPQARYVPKTYDYGYSGYQGNMYRVEDPYRDGRELLSFSDTNFMEQAPGAKFAYRTAPSTYVPVNMGNMASASGQYTAPVGPAYGVFPNSNIGGCNVPLLFSCAPTVVAGQMIKPQTQVYGSPPASIASHPDGYRGVSEHYLQRINANQDQALHDHIVPTNNVAAAHSNDKLS